jgi:hypothetical protein
MRIKVVWLFSLVLLGGCPVQGRQRLTALVAQPIYRVEQLPTATIYSLTIPAALAPQVDVAVSNGVATLSEFAQRTGAIGLLNGGFFDPGNRLTTSFVRHQGKVIANPQDNPRLTNNPDLQPYLPQIFDRSELRLYDCAGQFRFAIARHSQAIPQGCREHWAIGAGPQLLPQRTDRREAFLGPGRDPIGVSRPNARSAVGITATGNLIWLLVAQRLDQPASGLSLEQTASVLQQLGAITALNLDGGTSSALLWRGMLHKAKISPEGGFISRPVKFVLLLHPSPS